MIGLAAIAIGCTEPVEPSTALRIVDAPSVLATGALVRLSVRGASDVEWTSSSPRVATVSARGVVWARDTGRTFLVVRRLGAHRNADSVALLVGPRQNGKVFYGVGSSLHVTDADAAYDGLLLEAKEIAPGALGITQWDVNAAGTRLLLTLNSSTPSERGAYLLAADGTAAKRVATGDVNARFVPGRPQILVSEFTGTSAALTQTLVLVDTASGAREVVWTSEIASASGAAMRRLLQLSFLNDTTLVFVGRTDGFASRPELDPLQYVDSLYVAPLRAVRSQRRVLLPELAQSLDGDQLDGRARRVNVWRLDVATAGNAILLDIDRGGSGRILRARLDGAANVVGLDTLPLPYGAAVQPAFAPGSVSRSVGIRTRFSEVDDGLATVDWQVGRSTPLLSRASGFTSPVWRP